MFPVFRIVWPRHVRTLKGGTRRRPRHVRTLKMYVPALLFPKGLQPAVLLFPQLVRLQTVGGGQGHSG